MPEVPEQQAPPTMPVPVTSRGLTLASPGGSALGLGCGFANRWVPFRLWPSLRTDYPISVAQWTATQCHLPQNSPLVYWVCIVALTALLSLCVVGLAALDPRRDPKARAKWPLSDALPGALFLSAWCAVATT